MKIAKNKIRFYFYIGSVFSIIILSLIFYFNISISLQNEYKRKVDQLSTAIINEKKRFLKNAVDRTIQMIEIERDRAKHESESAGLSVDQVNAKAKGRIRNLLHRLRLIDDGYIWVNRIVNYDGGDKYAIREIHPNLPETEGIWLSTEITDIKGNKPYQAELDGMNKSGELYFEYYFKKLNSDEIAHKMSYAKLYKPFDWVVATGVYLDDVDELVKTETVIMQTTYKKQLLFTVFAAVAAVVLSTIVLIVFERQISRLIRRYEVDINKYTNSLIEEQKNTEKALEEKEFLMKELNHRVKNNLAMVSSLISLKDSEANEDLSDLKNRIDVIQLVHEKLHQQNDVEQIEVREYFQELLTAVFSSTSKVDVDVVNTIERISIPTKAAIPLGLVVNEIATNAIKYGFNEDEEALFSVDMIEDPDSKHFILRLSNTGNPFPENIGLENPETMGLQLVSALVSQLDGSIELQRSPNPIFTIRFPKAANS